MRSPVAIIGVMLLSAAALAQLEEPQNLPEVVGYCKLDDTAVEHLLDRGLLVVPDEPATNIYRCYYELEMSDLPVYVTADAMLYLWYEAHRHALMAAEEQILRSQLIRFADGMLQQTQAMRAEHDDPRLRENAVMLAVVRRLLEPGWEPPEEIATSVAAEVQRVMQHSLVQPYPGEDYTQYEVRGYYTSSEELSTYFRGAKYLARRYFAVQNPKDPIRARHELQRAVLLAEALRRDEDLAELYGAIYDLRAFLAGPADTIRLDQLIDACAIVWGDEWSRDDIENVGPLTDELCSDRYPQTRIMTRYVPDPLGDVMPPWNVAVLGEHYIPDSDLFHHTCEPQIEHRHLPTGLDVATALGSEAAAAKLAEVAADFPDVVPRAREFGPQMTGDSIYGAWLDTLRTLFEEPEGLPQFAKGRAWDEKQINCCLTSWAHLRHNYMLYGAQAYTYLGGSSGGGIVEPLPRFFRRYAQMCGELRGRLVERGLQGRVIDVLDALGAKAETFERCAADQLAGRDTSWADREIRTFGSWIKGTFFDTPLVIADVCTSSWTKQVLHAASGPFYPIVVLAEEDGDRYGAVGYVGSYYELVEPRFGRITDEQWRERVESEYARPQPPDWLADLYAPLAPEEAAARERLRELEESVRADLEEGLPAVEAFIAEHRNTPLEPAAALIAARYLSDAERYERVAEVLADLDRMYGCDARDAARQLLERAQSQLRHAQEQEAAREALEEALEPTAPREGLSPEEETARQDRRAEIILEQSEYRILHGREGAEDRLRRILEECSQSQYVPLAELGLVFVEFEHRAIWSHGDPRATLAEIAQRVRPRLQELAERYAGTPWELPMRTALASTWALTEDYETAWERTGPLLDAEAPGPGRHADALEWLERLDWDAGPYVGPTTEPRALAGAILEHIGPGALGDGDVARLQELAAVADRYDMPKDGPCLPSVLEALRHYGGEPEAFADFAPCLALEFQRGVTVEQRATLVQRALQTAEDHPQTQIARAALSWAVVQGERLEERRDVAEAGRVARKRLQDRYPDSTEALLVRVRRLNSERRWDEALAVAEQLSARLEDTRREDLPPHLKALSYFQDPAKLKRRHAEMLANWREKYGELIRAAGLPDDLLAEAGSETEIVEALLERLPDRQLEVLQAHGEPNQIHAIAMRVLEAHPDDPRALELRWEMRGRSNLLAIVAAGPDAAHFDEAIEELRNADLRVKYRQSLLEELAIWRRAADRHRGTPAEVLALATAARAYLAKDRPEQAAQFLERTLERVEEGRPLRDQLVQLLTTARQQIAAKRGAEAPRP
ncbi:MAG: DUF3160 domain-containing protein [Armatimonadota bacterium]|nr:DUF3160 domain-containing protein [Armatimonadota bacterium]